MSNHDLIEILPSTSDGTISIRVSFSRRSVALVVNFDKYSEIELDTLMTPYDYGSVMH